MFSKKSKKIFDFYKNELSKTAVDFFLHSLEEKENLIGQMESSEVKIENIRKKILKNPTHVVEEIEIEIEEEGSKTDFKNMTSLQYFDKLSRL